MAFIKRDFEHDDAQVRFSDVTSFLWFAALNTHLAQYANTNRIGYPIPTMIFPTDLQTAQIRRSNI